MAIVFDTSFDEEVIHFIGINSIIRYYSNSTVSPTLYSTITFPNNGVPQTKTIFPGPQNKFYYNFKEMMQILMTVNNFRDPINYSQMVNNWTAQSYRLESISIKIYFEDETFEERILDSSWLSCYFQYWNYKNNYYLTLSKYNSFALKTKLPDQVAKLKYWVGYPFSLSFYSGEPYNDPVSGTINGAGPQQILSNVPSGTRLVVSNGLTQFINLPFKINYLNFQFQNGSAFNIHVEKITSNCFDPNKVYLKWLNSMGDFDYYLFDAPDRVRSTKSLGSMNKDFENFLQTSSPEEQIGFEATDSFDIYGTYSPQDMVLISDLMISPKIYLFIGTPGAINTNQDWMEVKLKSSKTPLANRKSINVQHKFTLDMPDLNTRKL